MSIAKLTHQFAMIASILAVVIVAVVVAGSVAGWFAETSSEGSAETTIAHASRSLPNVELEQIVQTPPELKQVVEVE